MDEDINWVLVNKIDCAEEAILSNSAVLDSDQDSDGSISIISEYPTDNYSEDEILVHQEKELICTESKDEFQFERAYEHTAETELGSHTEVVDEESALYHESNDLDDNFSDFQFSQCEDSQELILHSQLALSDSKDKDISKDKSFSILAVGFLITILTSELIRHYSYEKTTSQSPSEATYMNTFSDDQLNNAIKELCVYKQRSKGDFSEQAVQKCVNHRLKKLKKDRVAKKGQAYMQIEKHYDNFKDSKESIDMVDNPIDDGYSDSNKQIRHSRWRQEENSRDTKMFERKSQFKNKKIEKFESKVNDIKKRQYSEKNEHIDKIKKKKSKKEDQLKDIKQKAKSLWDKQNLKRQYHRKDDPNEEWYIKYNPLTETIEVINITTLPKTQHINIIKNQDVMLNGEWYFSLYGNSREQLRKKEQEAEWYFRRGHRHKANKQIRAKWYFEYMSARGKTKYV